MTSEFDYIRENLKQIQERVAKAAQRSGRTPEDINIITVTKTVGIDRIKTVVDEGFYHLGENRVQELCEKYDNLSKECKWHLIGHLQTNKVKYIADKVSMIHSVDRLELASEIQKRSAQIGKTMDILVQVNVSGEESKFGIAPENAMKFIKELSLLKNIKVRGLMTIAPYVENPEDIRGVFKGLRKIFIDIQKENIDNIDMTFLSMGMSNDFEVAIEEGANLVRIGTSIFGKRQY
ncbi:MAG: YggS family pyridoxal phosphate-dependent enzyme [Clostridia bacterium]|nr:YggS family pyridoxal phosphate-dependent enzyme [Clostridia bacterium]